MAITDLDDADLRFVQGKGYFMPFNTLLSGTTTAAAAASGHLNYSISPNAIGSTVPSTLVSIPQSTDTTNPIRLTGVLQSPVTAVLGGMLAIIYKIGTVNLAATGDQFTHDTATFPITRTWFGTTVNIPLVPIIQVTTATTTTAPIIRMQTNAGGAGYVDQDGNATVGSTSLTFPNVATAVNTGLRLLTLTSDAAVQDVTAIEVTTASSTGAATVWGMEVISPVGSPAIGLTMHHDSITSGLTMGNLKPGAATTGTATTFTVIVEGDSPSRNTKGFMYGVVDV